MKPGISIAERIKETGGRTTGFDYLRIILATAVILSHSTVVSYGAFLEPVRWWHPWDMATLYILPMFFALSGFLVAGSLERCRTLITFFGLRVLRIVPALAVEVTLSALIFGPLLTSRTLADYYSDPQLASYFLNILGDIHFTLPGLFENNPHPLIVNNQLWTIPFELQCYLVLGGLAVAGLLRRKWLLLGIGILGQALWVLHEIQIAGQPMTRSPLASGQTMVIAFLCGVLLDLFRHRITLHWGIFLVCLAASLGLTLLPDGGVYLAFPAAYLTVYLGLLNPPSNRLLKSGDYSYGLYLYGYPIQQVVASIGPWARHWWINVAVALPAALLVAVFSWRVVEKPALALRRKLPGLENALHRLTAHLPTAPWLGLFPQACVLAGVVLIMNANERPGTFAILAGFGGAFCLHPRAPHADSPP